MSFDPKCPVVIGPSVVVLAQKSEGQIIPVAVIREDYPSALKWWMHNETKRAVFGVPSRGDVSYRRTVSVIMVPDGDRFTPIAVLPPPLASRWFNVDQRNRRYCSVPCFANLGEFLETYRRVLE